MLPYMKAAVFSDTHRNTRLMLDAIAQCRPDMVIHLGDHDSDTEDIRRRFPEIPLFNVCGNCDFAATAPETDIVPIGPVKAFITHGHLYNVKYIGADRLAYAAMEQDAKIAMFGHTHIPMQKQYGDVLVINPGTAGKGRVNTWALVEVTDDGTINCSINEL